MRKPTPLPKLRRNSCPWWRNLSAINFVAAVGITVLAGALQFGLLDGFLLWSLR